MLGQRTPALPPFDLPHLEELPVVPRSLANPFEHKELVWLFLRWRWRNRWSGRCIHRRRCVRGGSLALPSFKNFQGCSGFSIIALLAQDGLFRRILAPEVSKLLLGNFDLLSTILETVVLAQFRSQELQFSF